MYFKDLLAKLKKAHVNGNNPHYLFLLGTLVDFVEKPTDEKVDKAYIRGETFSYAAQLMTRLLGEQRSERSDGTLKYHSYHSKSVDVINGPDTPGFEIGERIAIALLLALIAIAEGKTKLNISGFSRGAVSCIVLTHELERVRLALEEDLNADISARRTLAAIISDSSSVPGLFLVSSYTKNALDRLVNSEPVEDEQVLKANLLANMQQLEVKLFLLDPVPGGNLGKVIRLGWQEKIFYYLPTFVKQKFEFVQGHETSNAFKVIVPEDMPYEVIPGCHGTGDGNQFDHNGAPLPPELEQCDLSGVQDLVLRRWIDFMDLKGQEINLEHEALDRVISEYLAANEAQRNKILLANYEQIQKNYPAFKWLSTRNYSGLGQHRAERLVHFHQRGKTPISDLDIHCDGQTFLNLQHVKLWISSEIMVPNFFDKSLLDQVLWLTDNIKTAFSTQSSSESNMIERLLQNKSNHTLAIESLSYLVSTVTQTYLRNHLSPDERKQCKQFVASTFATLDAATHNKDLTEPLKSKIKEHLTITVIQHHNSLLSLAAELISKDGSFEENISWLINTQNLVLDLALLSEQINALEEWCDQEMLMESFRKLLPFGGAISGDFTQVKSDFFSLIRQQRTLLFHRASNFLKTIPDALEKKPDELDSQFYDSIYPLASIEKREQELKALKHKAESHTKTITLHEKALISKDLLIADLKSAKERKANAKVVTLLKITSDYQRHLNKAKATDNNGLLERKKSVVKTLLDNLNDTQFKPSEQLFTFNNILSSSMETIKAHRDPAWQRFFRDCLRIISFAISGVGFYRMATGVSPKFFKPSQGEDFIEEATKTYEIG